MRKVRRRIRVRRYRRRDGTPVRQHRRGALLNVSNRQFLYGDFDGDGVRNYKDCRPFDPKRQHDLETDSLGFLKNYPAQLQFREPRVTIPRKYLRQEFIAANEETQQKVLDFYARPSFSSFINTPDNHISSIRSMIDAREKYYSFTSRTSDDILGVFGIERNGHIKNLIISNSLSTREQKSLMGYMELTAARRSGTSTLNTTVVTNEAKNFFMGMGWRVLEGLTDDLPTLMAKQSPNTQIRPTSFIRVERVV